MFVLVCVLCPHVSWNNSLNHVKGSCLGKKAPLLLITSIIRSIIKIKIQHQNSTKFSKCFLSAWLKWPSSLAVGICLIKELSIMKLSLSFMIDIF